MDYSEDIESIRDYFKVKPPTKGKPQSTDSEKQSPVFKKDARKTGKVRTDLISPYATMALGRLLEIGCRSKEDGGKGYAPWDWTTTTSVMDCLGAIERHSARIKMGEITDDGEGGTGMTHASCIYASAMILCHIFEMKDLGARYDIPDLGTTDQYKDFLRLSEGVKRDVK